MMETPKDFASQPSHVRSGVSIVVLSLLAIVFVVGIRYFTNHLDDDGFISNVITLFLIAFFYLGTIFFKKIRVLQLVPLVLVAGYIWFNDPENTIGFLFFLAAVFIALEFGYFDKGKWVRTRLVAVAGTIVVLTMAGGLNTAVPIERLFNPIFVYLAFSFFVYSVFQKKIGPLFRPDKGVVDPVEKNLTKAEIKLLPCVMRGLTQKEISLELAISHSTVKSHLGSIYKKLGVSGWAGLLVFIERNEIRFPQDS